MSGFDNGLHLALGATGGPWFVEDTEDASGLQVCATQDGQSWAVAAFPASFARIIDNSDFVAFHSPDVVEAMWRVVRVAEAFYSGPEGYDPESDLRAALEDLRNRL